MNLYELLEVFDLRTKIKLLDDEGKTLLSKKIGDLTIKDIVDRKIRETIYFDGDEMVIPTYKSKSIVGILGSSEKLSKKDLSQLHSESLEFVSKNEKIRNITIKKVTIKNLENNIFNGAYTVEDFLYTHKYGVDRTCVFYYVDENLIFEGSSFDIEEVDSVCSMRETDDIYENTVLINASELSRQRFICCLIDFSLIMMNHSIRDYCEFNKTFI